MKQSDHMGEKALLSPVQATRLFTNERLRYSFLPHPQSFLGGEKDAEEITSNLWNVALKWRPQRAGLHRTERAPKTDLEPTKHQELRNTQPVFSGIKSLILLFMFHVWILFNKCPSFIFHDFIFYSKISL